MNVVQNFVYFRNLNHCVILLFSQSDLFYLYVVGVEGYFCT